MARLSSGIKVCVFLSDFAAAFVVQRLRKLRSPSLLLPSSFASTADIGRYIWAPLNLYIFTADRKGRFAASAKYHQSPDSSGYLGT